MIGVNFRWVKLLVGEKYWSPVKNWSLFTIFFFFFWPIRYLSNQELICLLEKSVLRFWKVICSQDKCLTPWKILQLELHIMSATTRFKLKVWTNTKLLYCRHCEIYDHLMITYDLNLPNTGKISPHPKLIFFNEVEFQWYSESNQSFTIDLFFAKIRSSHSQMFFEIGNLKTFANFTENSFVGVSCNQVAGLQAFRPATF